MRIMFSVALLLLAAGSAFAGSPPRWVTDERVIDDLRRQITTNSEIMRYSGWGADPNEATGNAENEAVRNLMSRYGMDCSANNGLVNCEGSIIAKYKTEAKWVGQNRETRGYVAYLLIQSTVYRGNYTVLSIDAAERRARGRDTGLKPLIPGMAQIHKEENFKGGLFIAGTIAFGGAAVVYEGLRADYAGKMRNSLHNAPAYNRYRNDSRNMGNIRNAAIFAAAAVYGWNVIDGYVARGRATQRSFGANIELTPYMGQQSGVVLTLNF